MAEAPAQKRKHDKASGARKRRRVRSSLEGAPTESASSLGNVAIFTDVWGWRVRPGGRHDGKEGDDYLLGELAVLRYIEDMRTNEVAAEEATQSTDEGGAGVRAVGQAVVTEHHNHRTSDQEARSTSRAAGAVGDGSEAWGDVGAGEIVVAGTRGRGTRRGRDVAGIVVGGGAGVASRIGEVGDDSACGSGLLDQEVVMERSARGRGRGARGGRTARRVARALSTAEVDIGCDVAPSDGAVVAEVTVVGRGAQGRSARERGARGRGGLTGRSAAGTADTTVCVGVRADDTVSQATGSARDGYISVATVPESSQPGSATLAGATEATTTPSHTPPIMLQDVYVSKLVAFSPGKQRWMKAKAYRPIGTAYIIGRVYRQVKKGKNASLFQIRRLDSHFQGAVEHISVGMVQLGIKNYIALTRVKNPDWRVLVRPDPKGEIDFEEDDLDEEVMLETFDPTELLPTSLAEVEAIRIMRLVPSGEVEAPSYLYQHSDGSMQTYLRPEFEHLFEHSASSSGFAYIPLYFWRQVLHETNKYAVVNKIRMQIPFTLDELMIFLGILFFMAMNDKDERHHDPTSVQTAA
ncbi:hypothetical protein PC119_g15491 [Phytophthora cactorum]|nr:hypothetical protein PC111_g13514 [Phytophthora cactorum]KAG3004836.1 hypothetical protein PC119_g15491 [Phytophthora cactorum]